MLLCFAVPLVASVACGDDDPGGPAAAGSAGRAGAAGSAGLGGSAGAAGSAGNAGAAGAGGSSTYSAAEACQLFAESTCAKAEECGLVLGEAAGQLICLQCSAPVVQTIATTCTGDLSEAKDRAAVDTCIAGIRAATCADACSDVDVPACSGVFDELDAATEDADAGEPVVCDERCFTQ